MEIKSIKKKGKKYELLFSTGKTIEVHESALIEFRILKPKIDLDDEKINNLISESNYFIALDDGIKYASRIKTISQTKKQLSAKYSQDIVERVTEKLISMKLLDDYEYSLLYVDYGKRQLYGPKLIKYKLQELQVPDNLISNALLTFTKEEEISLCEKLFAKYLQSHEKVSIKEFKGKCSYFLDSKGFSRDVIAVTLENNPKILDNIDEDYVLKKEIMKKYRQYKSKYVGNELKKKIIDSLYRKGFSLQKIKLSMESWDEDD